MAESVYRQGLRENYARYIVTTARLSGRPLTGARFEVRLPKEAEAPEVSYPFEQAGEEAGTVWICDTRDFFPDREIVVRWR